MSEVGQSHRRHVQRPGCVLCTWRWMALTHLHRAIDLEGEGAGGRVHGRSFDWQCPPPPPPHTHTYRVDASNNYILSRGASSVPYFLAFLDLHHSTRATKPSAVNFYFLSVFVSTSVSLSPPPPSPPSPRPPQSCCRTTKDCLGGIWW